MLLLFLYTNCFNERRKTEQKRIKKKRDVKEEKTDSVSQRQKWIFTHTHIHLPDNAVTWPPTTVISIIPFCTIVTKWTPQTRADGAVCACVPSVNAHKHTHLCECEGAWNEDHFPAWIACCHSWLIHMCRGGRTHKQGKSPPPTGTHTYPLLKRHIGWIYCVLSCCLLWMGKAAYLQWIVNPAERSAVRDLWIANMLYFAPLIPLYLPPITFTERSAKRAGNQRE